MNISHEQLERFARGESHPTREGVMALAKEIISRRQGEEETIREVLGKIVHEVWYLSITNPTDEFDEAVRKCVTVISKHIPATPPAVPVVEPAVKVEPWVKPSTVDNMAILQLQRRVEKLEKEAK